VHSKPYSPEGRGKQERLNRYIREAFLSEATHQGISSLEELNDLFFAWAEQVANRRGTRRPTRRRSTASSGQARTAKSTPISCERPSGGR
jgi:hypothetical protein